MHYLSFGFSFFIRVFVPGAFAALMISPFHQYVSVSDFGDKWYEFYLFVAIIFGLLSIFIGDQIYKFFEGYLFWPAWLRNASTKHLNEKIVKMHARYNSTASEMEQVILMGRLMRFPLKEDAKEDEPRFEAIMPTKLGNILYAYEHYPNSRYGIDSIFFWPMFWLSLDKDSRKEIDEQWVFADCLTYISFWSLFLGAVYVLVLIADIWGIPAMVTHFFQPGFSFVSPLSERARHALYLTMSALLIGISRGSYLVSLRHHIRNGTFYQAIFAIKRDEVKYELMLRETDRDWWYEMWVYLQYKMVKCRQCGNYYPKESLKNNICNNCLLQKDAKEGNPTVC
jgi:hypothetical protein